MAYFRKIASLYYKDLSYQVLKLYPEQLLSNLPLKADLLYG